VSKYEYIDSQTLESRIVNTRCKAGAPHASPPFESNCADTLSSARDRAPGCAWSDRSMAIVLPSRPTAAKERASSSVGAPVPDGNLVKFQLVRCPRESASPAFVPSLNELFWRPVTSHD